MADLIGTDETTEEDLDMTNEDGPGTDEELEIVDDPDGGEGVDEADETPAPEPSDDGTTMGGVDETQVDDALRPATDPAETVQEPTAVATDTPAAPEPSDAVVEPDAAEDEVVEDEPAPVSPYDMPGDWYVIHSYSGYENKVKVNLESRISSMHMEDRIFEVHIPMEDVVEIKNGKKITVPRKVFPGYILVRMTLDDDSWYAVRNTPGVTGFVGGSNKPTPLSRREVERFLGFEKEQEKPKPRFKPEWEVGEVVRVVMGPFADFNGKIEGIDLDQSKVTVLVNIFGRDTPVELGFGDIQKG